MGILEKKWEFLSNDLAFPNQCFESCSEVIPSRILLCFIISDPKEQVAIP